MQINTLDRKINSKEWVILQISKDSVINIPIFGTNNFKNTTNNKSCFNNNNYNYLSYHKESNDKQTSTLLSSIVSGNTLDSIDTDNIDTNIKINDVLRKPLKIEITNSGIKVKINIIGFIRNQNEYRELSKERIRIRISAGKEIENSEIQLDVKIITHDIVSSPSVDSNESVFSNIFEQSEQYITGKAKTTIYETFDKNFDISVMPELEVCSNNVTVNHSVSIGPLDKDILFFLNCRGIKV